MNQPPGDLIARVFRLESRLRLSVYLNVFLGFVVTALAVALVDKTKQLALYQGVDEMIKNFTVRE